jgi:hypothetical protein
MDSYGAREAVPLFSRSNEQVPRQIAQGLLGVQRAPGMEGERSH